MLGTACCYNWFLDKKRTKREISGRFSGKDPYNRTTIFQNVTVFYDWYLHLVFFMFLVQKKKGEISDRFSVKTPYNRKAIFKKRNGFLWQVQRVFLTGFWSKKGQNVRFQADFRGKPLIIERQFFQNVTVFYDRY